MIIELFLLQTNKWLSTYFYLQLNSKLMLNRYYGKGFLIFNFRNDIIDTHIIIINWLISVIYLQFCSRAK